MVCAIGEFSAIERSSLDVRAHVCKHRTFCRLGKLMSNSIFAFVSWNVITLMLRKFDATQTIVLFFSRFYVLMENFFFSTPQPAVRRVLIGRWPSRMCDRSWGNTFISLFHRICSNECNKCRRTSCLDFILYFVELRIWTYLSTCPSLIKPTVGRACTSYTYRTCVRCKKITNCVRRTPWTFLGDFG